VTRLLANQCLFLLTMLLISYASTRAGAGDAVDYARDIKPILKAKCYSCHGALKQEGNLRLDTVPLMKTGGDSGSAVNEDDGLHSELLRRILADESERMPPAGEPLSPGQIERVTAWLSNGINAPTDEQPQTNPKSHWAFQPLNFDRPSAAGHPIDAFIDRRLATAGLRRAPKSQAAAVVRRMFLDLHGLLPTPQQMDDWTQKISANSEHGTTALITELLSRPRYGERWAQHWLDVVRYADTHGYEVNTPRPNAWPYRDYVIQAFNEDKPYDRFVFEQLAGDTVGEDAATGFLVAAAALLPGQIGKDEASKRLARQDELDEVIIGTSATFLGLTVGCARCHDHKFDPIPQQDYYAFQAFFAGMDYGEREIRGPEFERRQAQAAALQPRITQLQQQLNQLQPMAFTGRTILIDDEDLARVTLLKTKNGHGTNPAGKARGYQDDVGDSFRFGNLSHGRYTWWDNQSGEDVFTWNPAAKGDYRLWISWGVHGSGVHTNDARYVLDVDGDLDTNSDQSEIARADQLHFAYENSGKTEQKPLWSGLFDAGVHTFTKTTRLVLRGGETGTGITADVIVLQQPFNPLPQTRPSTDNESSSERFTADNDSAKVLPQLRGPVNPLQTVEHFIPTNTKFVRFTSLATIDDNKHQPCLDELEVFNVDGGQNIALATNGTVATSSGDYSSVGKHQLKHINDGQYGNSFSWISNAQGTGWVQLEFTTPHVIDRIEWSRDREGKFNDRVPVRYHIETSLDGQTWNVVATSGDRVAIGTPHDKRNSLLRHNTAAGDVNIAALAKELTKLEQQQAELHKPQMVFAGRFRTPDETFVLSGGDPEQRTTEVTPHVLTSLSSLELSKESPDQQRRTTLANWIASPHNPLTARVIANRIWQSHFGIGLVETSSDFGLNGLPPSHPELLDRLAIELIEHNWSIKHLHRLIMSSKTYQQASSQTNADNASAVDANNQLLWQFPSRRLEAEAIRDCMLQVSGQLNLQTGGPGFNFFKTRGGLSGFPPVEEFTDNEFRRMIYAHKIRMERVPVFGAFDCPDAGLPTPRRGQSTTAIQALNLFNSPFVIDQSTEFTRRIREEAGSSSDQQIDHAFRLAFGRPPSAEERSTVSEAVGVHGLETLSRAIFNSSEFLFIP